MKFPRCFVRKLSYKQIVPILIGCFVVLCSGCHKYPKDPFISLREPDKRLESATWQFTSYQINGVEHSHDFDSLLAPTTLTNCFMIIANNQGSNTYFFSLNSTNLYDVVDNGTWAISSDYKTLQLISVSNGTIINEFYIQLFKPVITGPINWGNPGFTIRELYGKHLHISNNGIDIYFEKK